MKAVSSLSKQPISGASVQIRILSTVAKPSVDHIPAGGCVLPTR